MALRQAETAITAKPYSYTIVLRTEK